MWGSTGSEDGLWEGKRDEVTKKRRDGVEEGGDRFGAWWSVRGGEETK